MGCLEPAFTIASHPVITIFCLCFFSPLLGRARYMYAAGLSTNARLGHGHGPRGHERVEMEEDLD